jgi:uncharacterized protein
VNICLYGATGRVGKIILENALSNQHTVQALVREPEKLNRQVAGLKVTAGNVLNDTDIANSLKGTEVVVSALNTDGTTTLSDSMPLIIRNMKKQKINRIITIGTAGILQARSSFISFSIF